MKEARWRRAPPAGRPPPGHPESRTGWLVVRGFCVGPAGLVYLGAGVGVGLVVLVVLLVVTALLLKKRTKATEGEVKP